MSPCYFPGRSKLQLPMFLFGQMWDSSKTAAMLLWSVQSPDYYTAKHIYSQANCSDVLSSLEQAHLQNRQKEIMISCEKTVLAGCTKKNKKPSLWRWKSCYRKSTGKVSPIANVSYSVSYLSLPPGSITASKPGFRGLTLRNGCRQARSAQLQ